MLRPSKSMKRGSALRFPFCGIHGKIGTYGSMADLRIPKGSPQAGPDLRIFRY